MAFALENTKFYLQFMDASSAPTFEIAEPIGFDALSFQIKQDNNRLGRDVTFAEEPLEFSPLVNVRGLTHQFDRLIGFYNTRGFEARVLFKIEISGVVYVLGQLDYLTCDTDRVNYFKASIVQDLLEARLKRHLSTKVDLYSNEPIFQVSAFETIDFQGLAPEKILLQSLPLEQQSTWRKPEEINFNGIIIAPGNGFSFSPFAQVVDFEIENTLSPSTQFWNFDGRDDYVYLEAQNTLTEIEMTLSLGAWNFNGDTGFTLAYRKGVEFDESTPVTLQTLPASATDFSNTYQLPSMERGERLWIYIRRVEGTGATFTFTSGEISINTVSTAVSSIIDGIRIGDAMKHIVRSIANADFDAPRFLENGQFENQFIFKGNQLRLLQDKPFSLSFNDCLDWLRSEVNGDFQVMPNGSIFVGLESDFYQNLKIGEFLTEPNDTYSESINEKFAINRVEWKYQKYEQGSNGDETNSLQSIHTESEYITRNQQVENVKSITVPFIRDAFLLEKTRKTSVFETESTARSEDEDTFIVDIISGTKEQRETFKLNHSVRGIITNFLTLTNNGSFNFILAGFEVGLTVQILGENQATYEVVGVQPTKMLLVRLSPGSGNFNGITLTEIIWTPNVNFTNRTDEGIASISGTKVAYSNMLWSIPRNLTQYYGRYLKTALRYFPTSQLRNTFFRNGAEVEINATTNVFGSNGKQNKALNITQMPAPILTDKIITTEVVCNFSDFWDILIKLREDFGYCEIKRTNGTIARIFVTDMSYNWKDFLLTITGEEQAKTGQLTAIS